MRDGGVDVEPIIGLEVHVQLATRTKLFCSCPLEFGAPPNSRTCPVCLGLPGALPVLNRQAVELAIRAGLALQSTIADVTRWDRKGYYYPDLPKNYQISQFDLPLCRGGHFELPHDGAIRKIRIRRAHLEEDAGKNLHDVPGVTAVDLNRAGAPLLEIVTEPDLRSADECRELAVQLQRLMSYLGVSEANMKKGQMRFEPNVNLRIRRDGGEYYTPIAEVKNLNSFRAVHGAVAFEIRRQLEEWQATGRTAAVGNKVNRGWDDEKEITVAQREKEEAHDYRYFPDPDLAELRTDAAWIALLRDDMPELPLPRTERFVCEYKLPPRDAPALVDDRSTADLLDHAAERGADKPTLGRHFLSLWSKLANERQTTIAGLGLPAEVFADLADLVQDRSVNATAAAQIAEELVKRSFDAARGRSDVSRTVGTAGDATRAAQPTPSARAIATELGLLQSQDASQIAAWVDAALAANTAAVRDARENPRKRTAARGFLLGQVMKLSGGRADPARAGEILDERLGSAEPS